MAPAKAGWVGAPRAAAKARPRPVGPHAAWLSLASFLVAWASCRPGLAQPMAEIGVPPQPTTAPKGYVDLAELYRETSVSVVCLSAKSTSRKQPATAPATRPAGRPATRPAETATVVTRVQWATAIVLHKSGFLLTNAHALRLGGRRMATLSNGTSLPVEVVAVDEGNDLAVLRVRPDRPLKPLRLGTSSDVVVGRRAISIGNPFGMGLTLGTGYITAVGRDTKTEYTQLVGMLQTNANVNPGCSGGPLLDARGECIGVITSQKTEAQGIGFATPVDKVRALLGEMIDAEGRWGFVLGLTVAANGPAAVTAVAPESPARRAGLREGDVVTALDDRAVRCGMDFHLALVDRRAGQRVVVHWRRGDQTHSREITLAAVAFREPADVAPEGLRPGLVARVYGGAWKCLPDFARYKPVATAVAKTFTLGEYADKDAFAMQFEGYLRVETDGVYALAVRSDDGSRLFVGSTLVVDNDGAHPSRLKRGFISLRAGLHPIRLEYFESIGDAELSVRYAPVGKALRVIPPAALFHAATPATRATHEKEATP